MRTSTSKGNKFSYLSYRRKTREETPLLNPEAEKARQLSIIENSILSLQDNKPVIPREYWGEKKP